jgi:SAM-dependent methyltransferase
MKADANYQGWNTKGHLDTFDVWNRQTDAHFNFAYGCFAEQRFLQSAVESLAKPSVLDVGCATGTTYRFLRNAVGLTGFSYRGVDLSQPAIEKAKRLYPGVDFAVKEREPLPAYLGRRYDIVYSRDTIMHQTEPLKFLDELLDAADRRLIVRLRTRDSGPTEFDVERSCQAHYDGYWMPYVVLNSEELIAHLRSRPFVREIRINRSYEVLGGHNLRYLPKDLYFATAGGAETAVSIGIERAGSQAPAEVHSETQLEGHAYLRRHRLKRYAYAVLSRVARRA